MAMARQRGLLLESVAFRPGTASRLYFPLVILVFTEVKIVIVCYCVLLRIIVCD